MSEFRLEERVPRQQAAERLADLAYALTAGGTLELRLAGERISVPIADDVVLVRTSSSDGRAVNHIELVMTSHPARPQAPRAGNRHPTQEHIMSGQAATPQFGTPRTAGGLRDTAREITGYWWVGLVTGIAWLVIALVILQFDAASVTTVGVLVGVMFVFAGAQNLALATMRLPLRWLWAAFGVLFLISAVICFVEPEETFAGLADVLGFLFLIVGVWWMVRAFIERAINPLWWLGLITGILMTSLAFWTAGQFFIEKAYLLLVFAGIWALMEGVTDIVRAFAVRSVHREL